MLAGLIPVIVGLAATTTRLRETVVPSGFVRRRVPVKEVLIATRIDRETWFGLRNVTGWDNSPAGVDSVAVMPGWKPFPVISTVVERPVVIWAGVIESIARLLFTENVKGGDESPKLLSI